MRLVNVFVLAGVAAAALAPQAAAQSADERDAFWSQNLIAERRQADDRENVLDDLLGAATARERHAQAELARLRAQLEQSLDEEERRIGAMLREGRLSEALDAMEAIARRSEGETAAEWWRRLGVFAGEDYPQRARNANSRALELAPNNYEAILAVANDIVDAREFDRFDEVEELYERAGALAQPGVQMAAVYEMISEADEADGDIGSALTGFGYAVEEIEPVALAGDDDDARGTYCMLRGTMAELRVEIGGGAEQESDLAFGEVVEQCAREMVARFGEDRDRLLLGFALLMRANHLAGPGNQRAQAQRLLNEAGPIVATVEEPALRPWARTITAALTLTQGLARPAEAELYLRQSVAAFEEIIASIRLGESAPAEISTPPTFLGDMLSLSTSQEMLALSHAMLGSTYLETVRHDEALVEFEASIEVLRLLSARTNDRRYQRRLVQALSTSALPLMELGRGEEAAQRVDEAVVIARRVHALRGDLVFDPTEAMERAAMLADRDDPAELAEASSLMREAVGILRDAKTRGLPGASDLRLAELLETLGTILADTQPSEAKAAFREALDLYVAEAGLDPLDRGPIDASLGLARLEADDGNWSAALAAAESAERYARAALAAGHETARKGPLWTALSIRITALEEIGRLDEARTVGGLFADEAAWGESDLGAAITADERITFSIVQARHGWNLVAPRTTPSAPQDAIDMRFVSGEEGWVSRQDMETAAMRFGEALRLASAAAEQARSAEAYIQIARAHEGLSITHTAFGRRREDEQALRASIAAFEQALRRSPSTDQRAFAERKLATLRDILRQVR